MIGDRPRETETEREIRKTNRLRERSDRERERLRETNKLTDREREWGKEKRERTQGERVEIRKENGDRGGGEKETERVSEYERMEGERRWKMRGEERDSCIKYCRSSSIFPSLHFPHPPKTCIQTFSVSSKMRIISAKITNVLALSHSF